MKKKQFLFLILLFLILTSCSKQDAIVLKSDKLGITLGHNGELMAMTDLSTGTELMPKGMTAALATIERNGDVREKPVKLEQDPTRSVLTLTYESGVEFEITYAEKPTHITFEVSGGNNIDGVTTFLWGPYPTTINETVGEIVGVARDSATAVGIQSLNTKTIGGFYNNREGTEPYKKGAARITDFGSEFGAYSFDRSKFRHVDAWEYHFKNMPVAPIENETVMGSKIALFCSPESNALETIGTIEIEEGLPHPTINGEWVKTRKEASKAYFITDFNEANFDMILPYAKKMGVNSIYHDGPFETWGHFGLDKEDFPNGWDGMKNIVEKAKAEGIRIGAHTLTTFIKPKDAFITPKPHPHLAKTGTGILEKTIDATADNIEVGTDEYFKEEEFNWMQSVQIGDEIIRYRTVTKTKPYTLLDCERGAFGTTAQAHEKGVEVGKLMDHPYKVFFPDWELQKQVAQNLIDFFNYTGVSHMDFDGHEGAESTGHGDFSTSEFARLVAEGVNNDFVNGSSRITHFYWHNNHYINWGEPWYGGFRESQSERRFSTQPFLEANYLPNMLGWFAFKEDTPVEDIEWLMAKSAAYNAGFAFFAKPAALGNNPNTDQVLDIVKTWEDLRLTGAFTKEQRNLLKDVTKEFKLSKIDENTYKMSVLQFLKFVHTKKVLQPGEPTYSEFTFNNTVNEQPFVFKLTVEGDGQIKNPFIEVDNYNKITIPFALKEGQTITASNTRLLLKDASGKVLKTHALKQKLPLIGKGRHRLLFNCDFTGSDTKANVMVILKGQDETVKKK